MARPAREFRARVLSIFSEKTQIHLAARSPQRTIESLLTI